MSSIFLFLNFNSNKPLIIPIKSKCVKYVKFLFRFKFKFLLILYLPISPIENMFKFSSFGNDFISELYNLFFDNFNVVFSILNSFLKSIIGSLKPKKLTKSKI